MKPDPISRRTWGMEFLWILGASFVTNVFVIFLGMLVNEFSFSKLLIRYIAIAVALAVYIFITAVKQYRCIFYLRPIYQELLKSKTIEQTENEKFRLKVIRRALTGNLISIVIVTAIIGFTGENQSFAYYLLFVLYLAFLFTIIFYPREDLKYHKEMCEPHLDSEAKEYIKSLELTWADELLQLVPMLLLVILLF